MNSNCGTEVEIMETVDYGDTDLRSVIEGDRHSRDREEESFGKHGYTQQEFEGEELVDVEEEDEEEKGERIHGRNNQYQ